MPVTSESRLRSLYRWGRWPLLFLAGTGLFFFAAWRLTQPDILQQDDFVEYWAAGRLNAAGQNPYDPESILRLERWAGRPLEDPMMMWNPPWVLPPATMLGLLPYPMARSLWFFLHFIAIAWSADRLWLLYKGSPRYRFLAWGLAFLFGPTLHQIEAGQISALLLLGVVGFLHFAQNRRWLTAGLFLSLAWIKPQVPYLIVAAVLLWAIRQRNLALALALLLPPVALTAWVGLVNPAAITGYLHALSTYPPVQWATPTLGGWLRLAFGVEHFGLQWVSPLIALIGLAVIFYRQYAAWDWKALLPRLTLWSLITMAYGWIHDHILALTALIPAAIQLGWKPEHPRWWILILSGIGVNLLLMFTSMDQFWYVWTGPFWLLWTEAVARWSVSPQPAGGSP